MSSALKPVLTPGGPQSVPVTAQLSKPMLSQGPAASYSQSSTHMPQNLVSLPQNQAHSNALHSANYYSLNVPSTCPSSNQSAFPTPSAHPVPSVSQTLPATTFNSAPKNPSYQPNLGQPPIVPVTQSLPATQSSAPTEQDKPQSNGTPEPPPASEVQQNHVSSQKEKPPTPLSSPDNKAKPEAPEKTSPVAPPPLPSLEQKIPETKEEAAEVSAPISCNLPAANAAVTESKREPPTAATADSSTESISKDNVDEKEENKEVQNSEEQATTTTPTASTPTKTEQSAITSTVKTTMKLATTPRMPVRKSRTLKPEEAPKSSESKPSNQKSPSSAGKSKRTRTRTQPYQCPLPEIEIVTKMSTSSNTSNRNMDDKLIIFYKNEFLAVRNSEGSFYICQAMQNIYKSSPKIKIRWLSQDKTEKSGEIYTPDFYDQTDFDCILTNLELERVDKGKYRLPAAENIRTDSILKRALAVEKGDATPPSLTEEHPDGLDLSLYKEESQLKKRRSQKRKAQTPLKASNKVNNTKKSPEQAKVRKVVATKVSTRTPAKKSPPPKKTPEPKKTFVAASGRSERAKRRSDSSPAKTSPVVDPKKAKVLAKIGRKAAIVAPKPQPPKTNAKTAAKATPPAKTQKVAAKPQVATRKTKRTRK